MICEPVPVTDGSKFPPDTPVPLYVPPEGEPPDSATGAALIQIPFCVFTVTTGNARTLMFAVAEFEQPFPSV